MAQASAQRSSLRRRPRCGTRSPALQEAGGACSRAGGAKGEWQPETEGRTAARRSEEGRCKQPAKDARAWTMPIRCVEAIDIAHLQGGETVGSKVCFLDGRPFKNEYRRYRIKGRAGGPKWLSVPRVGRRRASGDQ